MDFENLNYFYEEGLSSKILQGDSYNFCGYILKSIDFRMVLSN